MKLIWLLLLFMFFMSGGHALSVQTSLWGSYSFGLRPVPEKLDTTSTAIMGGPGIGTEIAMKFFFPFYYGFSFDYFPVYSEKVVFYIEEFGTVDVKASLTSTKYHGMIFFPIGEWILWSAQPVKDIPSFLFALSRGFFLAFSYGPNYFRVYASVQGTETITSASRMGWSVSGGFSYSVLENLYIRTFLESMQIFEADIVLWSWKTGLMYRLNY